MNLANVTYRLLKKYTAVRQIVKTLNVSICKSQHIKIKKVGTF